MASEYFLKIDTVSGESATSPDAIDITSFSWGVSQTASAAGGGAGAGKPVFQPMRFVAPTTTASAALLQTCILGKHLAKAVLTERSVSTDGTTKTLATYTLSDCLVTEYFVGGPGDSEDGRDVDTFSLNFSKIVVNLSSAVSSAKGTASWDLKANKA